MDYHLFFAFTVTFLHHPSFSTAGFAEVPSNITLMLKSDPEMDSKAVFRCRHQSINAFINWRVNGLPSGHFFDARVGSMIENNTIVNTLSIPIRLEYSGTEVECLANFVNGSPDISSAVVLTIMIRADFCEVPSPSIVIVTIEERYEYRCNHSQTSRIINWKINGSVVGIRNISQSVDTSILSFPNGDKVYTLTIGGLLEHNETTVQCIATLDDGSNPVETQTVLFLMQGTLNSIQELLRSDNILSWIPPFSLDLTNTDPDVIYCVEVYNITCGRSLLISECDVVETSYTSDSLLPGYIYEYTIIPRSNVVGASNGTSLTEVEKFRTLNGSKIEYKICRTNNTGLPSPSLPDISPLTTVVVRIHLDFDEHGLIITDKEIQSGSYSVLLKALDGLREYDGILIPASYRESVFLHLAQLPFRRLWNATVFAHNCKKHQITESFELSTHDISSISIASPYPGVVMVTGDVIDTLSSIGILIIVYSLTDDCNTYYNYFPYPLSLLGASFTVEGLPTNRYGVSIFVTEENGLPYFRAAATPRKISVEEAAAYQHIPRAITYEVHPIMGGMCITCAFLDSSATDCVVVVHQRISQLSSSGLMNIESSHKFNRSGDTAYGCIEGINLEQYQIGIEGGVQVRESTKTRTSLLIYAIGLSTGMLSVIVLVTVIVTITCAVIKVKCQNLTQDLNIQGQKSTASDITEIRKCVAYDIIQLSKERVTMDENPAYGNTGV